ncbi:helicase Cas3 [Thalassoglobus neptunius]|uniref:Helicase Cas3 n=1 Tax=Thalassoglobus neptunius TaxID=1938619 RepID=A0A5C5W9U9_9PLAN|nr:CRISPR-associated helicase Cas3' [Thalassoglobus neptunius]TWT47063.1 helicase Cas3 [Thalassoglobus neptunius]
MARAYKDRPLYFAHSIEGSADTFQWERLEVHLREVAELASVYASSFNAAEWGEMAGLLHDVGKYSLKFQDYLLTANGIEAHIEQRSKVDHATAGAQLACQTIPNLGRLLAYVIAGHHAGLADASGESSSLDERLKKDVEPYQHAPSEFLQPDISLSNPELEFDQSDREMVGFQLAFFTRMIFSCLVDADFLCTERFMSPERAEQRPQPRLTFEEMSCTLRTFLENKSATSTEGTVMQCRQGVLAACREAALLPPGLFSLTVPTGGGKTLSSLSFAIEHLLKHGKTRVIYAIPFTSIIEQTATVFREVFDALGDDIVLEHHSNLDQQREEDHRSRLAAENWDAPLVVTTNVQFFESLFANRTSRCRKLHNIVNSVIILDEAQTLPVDRLRPCLQVLNELTRNYGCTIVLCTATQPAIEKGDDFTIGLESVTEIIPDRRSLYRQMKRVDVKNLGNLTDAELIEHLSEHESFLTIVNTRGHAAKLYRELVEQRGQHEGLYHLSTLMCGEHRADVITDIRQRLKDRRPCRVISTQLIEAGVDVDFPVVYRAMTGIDSIAQAAGRCNREGRLDSANVYVFEPTDVRLIGYLGAVAQTAQEVIPDFPDLLAPEAIEKYFDLHYYKQSGENDWDKTKDQGVMNCFPFAEGKMLFNFRSAAERFQLIDDNGVSLFVPYESKGQKLIEALRENGPNRFLLRRLQRYSVNLFENLFQSMKSDIELFHDFPVLTNPSAYDKQLGVRIDRPGHIEAGDLIS